MFQRIAKFGLMDATDAKLLTEKMEEWLAPR
jgi:hypothetical protein